MTLFRVWAPRAERVELLFAEQRLPMEPSNALGQDTALYWELDVSQAEPGDDYTFILDGGDPLPDPRSPWQPHGVHGPSRLVDHSAFPWSDQQWAAPPLHSALVYELHVGTFTPTGTFQSAIERLDYLKELGVTHLQLMPVADFPGDHGWGYDGVSLFAPRHAYGGPQGLKELVNACHDKGLAVLLDVVYNHLGPDGNYLGQYGPYFTDRYETPWGPAVNLDGPGSDHVRRFFLDNALMWLRDYHIDGLRLDAIQELFDTSAIHFLEELATEVEQLAAELGRPLTLIAESSLNDPRVIRHRTAGGFGLDAQWNDDFHHALHAVLTGEQNGYYADYGRLQHLARALQYAYVYAGNYSPYRQRRHGRRPTMLPGGRRLHYLPGSCFLAYAQNHDQVGNRAQGRRLGHLVDHNLLKVGAALVFTAPFVPLLFQGEEWAASSPFLFFSDHRDPDLAQAVREGRKQEFASFGWDPADIPDPQDPHTFQRSKLDWAERHEEAHSDILDWYRRLIHLRREHTALQQDQLESVIVDYDEDDRWLVLHRGPLTVACNFASHPRQIPLAAQKNQRQLLLASATPRAITDTTITLPGPAVAIMR